MKISKKRLPWKFAAVVAAFVAAMGIVCGGAFTAAYAEEHVHTFSEEWSSGYKNHWHEADCGHGIVAGMAAHTFTDGVCTVCGEEKIDVSHVHTFKDVWKFDNANHWREATCGHNIVKDIAPHSSDPCVCGYTAGGSTNPDPGIDPNPDPNPGEDIEGPKDPAEVPAEINRAGGYNESLFAEWTADSVEQVTASYKEKNATAWTAVDENLIRINGRTARVDAVGLKEGDYDLKITVASGDSIEVKGIPVTQYDRSGYAHFKYTDGVGAYKDDGTLKDGALVIYVSNKTKNNVINYVYKNTPNGLVKEDITEYIKPGKPELNGKPLGGETYGSIGYILNNRGYANNTEREKYGIQKLTQQYGAVAVRLLDRVESEYDSNLYNGDAPTLTGLTYYAKNGNLNPITGEKYVKGSAVPNGGSAGDNGQMARITNAKNLTIEGIGEDAMIYGWGIHFVSNDNLHKIPGAGTSFEVRNITFQNYPEDAIGMEGTQGTKVDANGSITSGASSANADLISPVERCWIHNNVFLPGFCAKPAESDKAEGDGSCDFKRGQFYTLSYNYFTKCHKTNLIGSSDSSVSYNVSMHHNWWDNCGSRQPLARQANIHYYNNYIVGATDYVSSLRANCLIFSEANYYIGCKQITQKKDGDGVAWKNVYYGNYAENAYTELASRTQTVSNNCKFIYRNIDYSKFYVDADKFYYDAATQSSDCLLDTAATARIRVMMFAGVNGFGKSKEETALNNYTPAKAVELAESGETVIALPASKNDADVKGVMFRGLTGAASGTIKGKGQIITFTLASEAQLTVTTATTGDFAPELLSADGILWAGKFTGTLKIVLPAGTYFISSGQLDKEAVISALSFADTGNSQAARVQAAVDAINAIPSVTDAGFADAVKAAQTAYSALTASEKASFDGTLKAKLTEAVNTLDKSLADKVVALIDEIGVVTANSYAKINKAQTEYDKLTAEQKKLVANYSALVEAQAAFNDFAVDNLVRQIEKLPDVSQIALTDEAKINEAISAYNEAYKIYEDFGEKQKGDMDALHADAVKKLTDGLEALRPLPNLFSFKNALGAMDETSVTVTEGAELKELYEKLNAAQKNALTAAETEKYNKIIEAYENIVKQTIKVTFIGGKPTAGSPFVHTGTKQSAKNTPVLVHAYSDTEALASGLKFESTTELTLTLATKTTVTLYFYENKSLKIGGTDYPVTTDANGDHSISVTLEAGEYKLTQGSGQACLYFATLIPA